jgi:hypothetical protein
VDPVKEAVDERRGEIVRRPKIEPAQTLGILGRLPDGRGAEAEDGCGGLARGRGRRPGCRDRTVRRQLVGLSSMTLARSGNSRCIGTLAPPRARRAAAWVSQRVELWPM